MGGRCAPERAGRDRCPGVLALHHALDGGLARIRLPGGHLPVGSLGALQAAAELGSGLVELTARANIQLRGLATADVPRLAEILTGGGLLPSEDHDRVRNILACPLGGRGAASVGATDALVGALDREICADPQLARLPGRFLFAVDDGSGMTAGSGADVTLAAGPDGRFTLFLADAATTLRVPPGEAAAVAVAAAHAFLAVRGASEAWRVAELQGGAAAIATGLGAGLTGAGLPPGPRAPLPGALEQRDGRTAVTALVPLGRLDAAGLPGLAALGAAMRVSRGRALTLIDVDPSGTAEALDALARLGLVVEPRSGWTGLSACVGRGACAHAREDVRSAARARAAVRGPNGTVEHWSGCERRCGEPRTAPVTVAAQADGLVVRAGAETHVEPDIEGTLARLAGAA